MAYGFIWTRILVTFLSFAGIAEPVPKNTISGSLFVISVVVATPVEAVEAVAAVTVENMKICM